MSYRIEVAPEFARRLKKLSKRYKSIKQDYGDFLHSLQSNPLQGVDLGKGLRKIRMSIASKGKGKSGGARAQVRKSVDGPPGMLTEDHHHTVHEESQVCYSSHLRPKSLHL